MSRNDYTKKVVGFTQTKFSLGIILQKYAPSTLVAGVPGEYKLFELVFSLDPAKLGFCIYWYGMPESDISSTVLSRKLNIMNETDVEKRTSRIPWSVICVLESVFHFLVSSLIF